MLSQRNRPIVYSVVAVVAIWLLAAAGYQIAKNSKMTADKVLAYEQSLDFASLTGADRERAMHKLEDMLNALTLEERRRVWGEIMSHWFAAMTEDEKGQFIEATMPTGFKLMLNAFEQLPPDRQQKTIDTTLKNLREQRAQLESGQPLKPKMNGTNQPPQLSPELQNKIETIGLKSYYSQSTPEMKAELAPVLEEMQSVMELSRMRNNPQ